MAANSLAPLVPVVLAQGLEVLRSACVMPRLVNNDFKNTPEGAGDTINVWLASGQTPSAVTPGKDPVDPQASQGVKVPITLDQWRKNGFYMTDKEVGDIGRGFQVKALQECVRGLAEECNAFILTRAYRKTYGFTGTPGTTPFATDTTGATGARKILTRQLAPKSQRRLVLDPDAEANAVELMKLTTVQNVGNDRGITEGEIGRKLGFDFFCDQQVPTHISTPLTAGAATANGVQAVGAGSTDGGRTGTLSVAKATNTSPLVAGDIVTVAGDSQTYVVLTGVTLAVGNTSVSISPALKKATAGGEVIALKASHVVNLAFHPDAISFASRPVQTMSGNNENMMSISDPISGMSLRVELKRQNKQDYMEFDVLYGAECTRPEFITRVAG